jgi:hypothetical protein
LTYKHLIRLELGLNQLPVKPWPLFKYGVVVVVAVGMSALPVVAAELSRKQPSPYLIYLLL